MTELEQCERRLAEARREGDPDILAEALAKYADVLVRHLQLDKAHAALDEAAEIHRQRGRPYDEARCILFTASVCRLSRRLDEAEARIARAVRVAGPGGTLARDAEVE